MMKWLEEIKTKLKGYFGQHPRTQFNLIWVSVYSVIVVFFSVFFIPLCVQYEKIRSEVTRFQFSIQKMDSMSVTADNYQSKISELRQMVDLSMSQLVQDNDIPTVISVVSETAKYHKVELKKISSLKARDIKDFKAYKLIPLRMELSGEFRRVGDFFGALKNNIPWFFTWEGVKIRAVAGKNGFVGASALIGFYMRTS